MSSPSRFDVLIDAQLLVLLTVGAASGGYVAKHKRLQAYDLDDFDALVGLLQPPARLIVTPNILSEASNLLAHIAEPARTAIFAAFRTVIGNIEERYVPSRVAADHPVFTRLGLADAACLAADLGTATLLTADLDLYLAALKSGRPAVNFRHIRDRRL